ncbi:unnamed protein product [Anisakis simplex]|uniref:Secreted protein n=1 Tax=Anisakis simplex TaxID=6269 RepID=A0A0M3JAC4_ANISI|nr:unnamed protein product [Anisakis simplex]
MRQCCSLDARQALQAFAPSLTAARCVFARRVSSGLLGSGLHFSGLPTMVFVIILCESLEAAKFQNRSQTAELNDVSEGTSAINRTIESVASNSVDDNRTHQGMPVLYREHATTPCFVAPLPSDHQQSTTSVKKRPYHRRKDSFPQERSEASSKTNNK